MGDEVGPFTGNIFQIGSILKAVALNILGGNLGRKFQRIAFKRSSFNYGFHVGFQGGVVSL